MNRVAFLEYLVGFYVNLLAWNNWDLNQTPLVPESKTQPQWQNASFPIFHFSVVCANQCEHGSDMARRISALQLNIFQLVKQHIILLLVKLNNKFAHSWSSEKKLSGYATGAQWQCCVP